MTLDSIEKDQLSTLQGISNNFRDASRGAGTRWTQPKTAIIPPTNPSHSFLSGPYNSSRTRDTLSTPRNSAYSRHPIKDKKLTAAQYSPPVKKRKIGDQTFQQAGPSRGVRHSPKQHLRKDMPHLSPDKVVIHVDSDEEDVGERVESSDPIYLSPPGPSSTHQKHPFEVDDDNVVFASRHHTRKSAPEDGHNTQWLQEKIGTRKALPPRNSSPIDDFDDEPQVIGKQGEVRRMVQNIERQTRVNDLVSKRKAPSDSTPVIPHIDFKTMSVTNMKPTPNTVNSIKGGMKPRDPNANIKIPPRQPQRDVEATSPSGFTSGRRTHPSASSEIVLPVKEWFLGLNFFEEPSFVSFRKKGSEFTIRRKTAHSETIRRRDVASLEYFTGNEDQDPCMSLETDQKASALALGYESHFQAGGRGKGMIVILFDREADTWSDQNYKDFCQLLYKSFCNVSIAGSSRLWETHMLLYDSFNSSLAQRQHAQSRTRSPIADQDDIEETRRSLDNGGSSGPKTYKSNSRREISATSTPHELRRSSRVPSARTSARTTPQVDLDEVILSYPANTAGSVNITNGDLSRLEPGEYLNDTLIEFGLRLWHRELEEKDPTLASRIHVFNSFFYKKLTAKKSNLEETYQTVRRWTAKFDLFEKDFIIVPINEAMHWYLAIIYRPGQVLFPPPEKPPPTTRVRTRKSNINEITNKDDDAQEVRDVEDVEEALVPEDSTKSEPSVVENDECEEDEDELLNFETSVSTHYVNDKPSISKSPSPTHMDITEDPPLSPNRMDVDQVSAYGHTRARSSTVSDEDKPTSSTAATDGGQSPHSVTADLSMDVDELTLGDGGVELDVSALSEDDVPVDASAAQTSRRDKGKAVEVIDDDHSAVDREESAPKVDTVHDSNTPLPAYICTLDSLGSRHPSVTRSLAKYLQLEAKHKKINENTSDPSTKTLLVPAQPNYSDCGIYLLHFARVFVSKPDYFCNLKPPRSGEERKADWEAGDIHDFRENLRKRILELSEEWKRERAVQHQAKKQQAEKGGQPVAELIEDSDSDDAVIIESPPGSVKVNSKKGGRGGRVNQSRGKGKAVRLR